jgi:signal transduction histidine kinase
MRSFTADAAHELRTPLSIIRGEADVALSQDRPVLEYQEALTIIQDEARRLSRLVDDMLALARADAGQRPLEIRSFT